MPVAATVANGKKARDAKDARRSACKVAAVFRRLLLLPVFSHGICMAFAHLSKHSTFHAAPAHEWRRSPPLLPQAACMNAQAEDSDDDEDSSEEESDDKVRASACSPATITAPHLLLCPYLPNVFASAAGKAHSERQGRNQAGRQGCARKSCTAGRREQRGGRV